MRVLVVFAMSLMLAAPSRSEESVAAAPALAYPASVRLVMSSSALGAKYLGSLFASSATLAQSDVAVGRQASEAYAIAVVRMFKPADAAAADADLSVEIAESGVDLDRDGWFAYVEHEVLLRSASGSEIARWRIRGQGRIVGLGETAIPRAFADATSIAARTFEADFERPAGTVTWLQSFGVQPGSRTAVVPQVPQRFASILPLTAPPRADDLFFAEFGGGVLKGDGWASGTFAARLGWSGRPWLLQFAIDGWPRRFVARPPAAWGEAAADAFALSAGLDAGLQKRLTSHFEIAGGAGLALLYGMSSARYVPLDSPTQFVHASDNAVAWTPSVFAVARLTGVVPRAAFRYRLGLELRRTFASQLGFDGFGRSLDLSGFAASLFLGFELPLRRSATIR